MLAKGRPRISDIKLRGGELKSGGMAEEGSCSNWANDGAHGRDPVEEGRLRGACLKFGQGKNFCQQSV